MLQNKYKIIKCAYSTQRNECKKAFIEKKNQFKPNTLLVIVFFSSTILLPINLCLEATKMYNRFYVQRKKQNVLN